MESHSARCLTYACKHSCHVKNGLGNANANGKFYLVHWDQTNCYHELTARLPFEYIHLLVYSSE